MRRNDPGRNPFEAPREDPRSYEKLDAGEYPRSFRRDPTGLTATLKAFLWASIVAHSLLLTLRGVALALVLDAPIPVEFLDVVTSNQVAIALGGGAVLIVTIFIFLKWVYRMYLNVQGFGAQDLSTTPGWAIAWYFIPIAFLWKPYKTMKETWQASSDPSSWPHVGGTGLVGIWWFLYLSSKALSSCGRMIYREALTSQALRDSIMLGMAGEAASIVLCLVEIRMVSRICAMQKAWVEGELSESLWGPGR
jgi:hypothetical protein